MNERKYVVQIDGGRRAIVKIGKSVTWKIESCAVDGLGGLSWREDPAGEALGASWLATHLARGGAEAGLLGEPV